MTNPISPKKLLHSKWTAVKPSNKERHFIVSGLEFDDDGAVSLCTLQAVMTRRERDIDWRELKNASRWRQGWK